MWISANIFTRYCLLNSYNVFKYNEDDTYKCMSIAVSQSIQPQQNQTLDSGICHEMSVMSVVPTLGDPD